MAGVKKSKKTDKKHPIIVIGGGPSGMTAAQIAAGQFHNVILFDKNPEPGKKLLSLPENNLYISEELSCDKTAKAFGEKEEFIRPALKAFGWKDLAAHLAAMKIKLTSNGASHLAVSAEIATKFSLYLRDAADAAGVSIRKSSKVSEVMFANDAATGVMVNSVVYPASCVIIACGSVASPGRGATGDGYEFARKAGHTIMPIRPALVGLETEEKYGKMLTDAEFSDCKIDVFKNGQIILTDRGSLKFTFYGIEGELILTHSAKIIDLLGRANGSGNKIDIHIDMIPDISKKELDNWLTQQLEQNHKITVGILFEKYIPLKLRSMMSKIMRIHSDKPVASLSYLERKSLLLWVKDFHITVRRPRPFNETQGVLGGVCVDEIDRETMRSRKVKNLYFAGEVMDLLGPWGGYNIQMAFSTGFLAGLSAAKSLS
jgi:predicted Rossmann fold flavoprotein